MFHYELSFRPPAPALDIEVLHPITSTRATMLAKIDTAADQTILGRDVLNELVIILDGPQLQFEIR
jgi:hypothetical protein